MNGSAEDSYVASLRRDFRVYNGQYQVKMICELFKPWLSESGVNVRVIWQP